MLHRDNGTLYGHYMAGHPLITNGNFVREAITSFRCLLGTAALLTLFNNNLHLKPFLCFYLGLIALHSVTPFYGTFYGKF